MTPASASTATIHSPAIPRTRLNALRLIMVAAILIFGAWASMRYSFGAWAPDADIAGPVVVWEGVSHYGLGFLVSWHYTQDNWLFSLLPLTSVIFTLFGTNPKLVVGVGWLIFMASVGTTSFLVYRIAGRRAAIPVAVICYSPIFGPSDPLGSYPIPSPTTFRWPGLFSLWRWPSVPSSARH